MVAKPEACGLAKRYLQLISDYLRYCKKRTKFGSAYSDWVYAIRGIPQGFILDPLLFNIFIKEVQYTVCSEVNLAKWLSVRLRTKWLWVRVQLQ